LECGGGIHLAQETLRPEYCPDLGVQDLERYQPFVSDVSGEVHDGHAATSEFLLEHVAVCQSTFELVYGAGQVRSW